MLRPLPLDAADLDYALPARLVAQQPAAERGGSRLMVLEAGDAQPRAIGRFDELLLQQLRDDDLVVANDARVMHARIPVRRDTGGVGEALLLTPTGTQLEEQNRSRWTALARPARKYRPGMVVETTRGGAPVTFIERTGPQTWTVELPAHVDAIPGWLLAHGELPLPPYITEASADEGRYQTVHARVDGSVAAPTAGLHFDDTLWGAIAERCDVAHLTLHVGAGTFLPVADGVLVDHVMHSERYELPSATQAAVRAALDTGRRVVAVGTTTTRVLEHAFADGVDPEARAAGSTELFILPGAHRWSCVGALLTNFHLPRSTLIALVMSFLGVEETRAAYATAIAEQMRFYSFGDAMFIHGPPVQSG